MAMGIGKEAFQKLLRAGMSADGLVCWTEPRSGDVWAAKELAGHDGDCKPVAGVMPEMGAPGRGTLDGDNQMRIARLVMRMPRRERWRSERQRYERWRRERQRR